MTRRLNTQRFIAWQQAFLFSLSFSATIHASTITESASGSASVSQTGEYCLYASGNSHGWCQGPSPAPYHDGYNYGDWNLTFNLPAASAVTSATIADSWTINAPLVYPAVIQYPFGAIPWDQPIKYMSPATAGWLSEIAFSDGYTYWFPAPEPRQNPNSINLAALGLLNHLEDSSEVTLVGVLQYNLGRAYLADDWQHAQGWADWAITRAYGSATASAVGSLAESFLPAAPPPPPTPPDPVVTPEPQAFLFCGIGLVAIGYRRFRWFAVRSGRL